MKDGRRDFLILVGFIVGCMAVLSAGVLWVVNSGFCIGCGEARPTPASCYSALDSYNDTLESGETFEVPELCYSGGEGVGGLEGSQDSPDVLRKSGEGLVLNSTGEKLDWRP